MSGSTAPGTTLCPNQRCGAANPPGAHFCHTCGAALVAPATYATQAAAATHVTGGPGGFGEAFWVLNSIEMFERLSYYTLRVMAPVYIMQADDPGGLHLTAQHKGAIYAWWAIFQSILPMATGGFADRYGYKATMAFSISMMTLGYLMVAFLRDIVWLPAIEGAGAISALDRSNFWSLFIAIMVLATGTAFFKPSIQGSLAQHLSKGNSSVGWGIFYWVVNVGAFVGHYIPSLVFWFQRGAHTPEAWRYLFLLSALFASTNFILLFCFKDVPSGAPKINLLGVLGTTISNIWPYWLIGGRFSPVRGGFGLVMIAGGVSLWIARAAAPGQLWWLDAGVSQLLLAISPGSLPWQGSLVALVPVALVVLGVLSATWLQGGRFTWQLRLPIWLLIMSCFWMMMYQLWDLQPNFITDWIDSGPIAQYLPDMLLQQTPRGPQVEQQVLLSLNALCIILGVVGVAWLTRKMRTLTAMTGGMIFCTAGLLIAGLTMNPWMLVLGIVFFSLGEMTTGPKKNEYLALIAPPGKKGLYLGYVNIPVGVGVYAGSTIAGEVYGRFGEKATLALRYIAEKFPGRLQAAWDGKTAALEAATGIKRTEAFEKLQEFTGLDPHAATRLLWDTYSPQYAVWLPFAATGVVAAIALAIFGKMARRWKDMNA